MNVFLLNFFPVQSLPPFKKTAPLNFQNRNRLTLNSHVEAPIRRFCETVQASELKVAGAAATAVISCFEDSSDATNTTVNS